MSSQVEYPWRATLRTIAAVLVGTTTALGTAMLIFRDEMLVYLNADAVNMITYISGVTLAISAVITKIMANPTIDEALSKIHLGSEPKYSAKRSADDN